MTASLPPAYTCPRCGVPWPAGAAFCSGCGASYAQAWQPAPAPQPTAAPGRPAAAPTAIVALVAGVLAVAAAFLPWLSVTSGFASISRTGIEGGGDGQYTLAAGGLAALYGLLRILQPIVVTVGIRVLLLLIAGFIGWIAVTDIGDVTRRIGELGESLAGSVGVGLYLTAFSAVVLAVAAVLPNRAANS